MSTGTAFDDIFSSFNKTEGFDWVPVVSIDGGGGYDWTEMHAWYSPRERRYFWGSGEGCSCNYFAEDFTNVGDFENGDRPALLAAARRFAEDYSYAFGATELVDALTAINQFNPKELA